MKVISALKIICTLTIVSAFGVTITALATTCPALSGIPGVELVISDFTSCTDLDPDTFMPPTKESFCECQAKAFKLLTEGNRQELQSERKYSLGSFALYRGHQDQIEVLNELSVFEGIYQLEDSNKFNCHIAREVEASAKACGSDNSKLQSFLNRTIDEAIPSDSGPNTNLSGTDRLLRAQVDSVNESNQKQNISCLESTEGSKTISMMMEMMFDNVKDTLLKDKESFLADPQIFMAKNLNRSLPVEAQEYSWLISEHPLGRLILDDSSNAKVLIDWLEQNQDKSVEEIFNSKSSNPLALAQQDYFQKKCDASLAQVRAGVKTALCAEDAFKMQFNEPSDLSSTNRSLGMGEDDGAELGLARAEAFSHRYCSASVTGDENTLQLMNDNLSDASTSSDALINKFKLDNDEHFCQSVCVSGTTQVNGACELKPIAELASEVESPKCQSSAYNCLELKAYVRMREREAIRETGRQRLGLASNSPVTTLGKIFVDQGVPANLARSVEEPSSNRTNNRVNDTKKSALIAKNKADNQAVNANQTNSKDPVQASDDADAAEDFAARLKRLNANKDQGFKFDENNARQAASPKPSQRELDRLAYDKEAKKLRSALNDFEKMKDETIADWGAMKDPEIPYAYDRTPQVGEDLQAGDLYGARRISRDDFQAPRYPINRPVNQLPLPNQVSGVSNAQEATPTPNAAGTEVSGPSIGVDQVIAPPNESGPGRSPAQVGTVLLRYKASDLSELNPEVMEKNGLSDKNEFMLEVVMSEGLKKILIPVYKRTDEQGKIMWEPQLTNENREYFERVLEIPLFKDFKQQLIKNHFSSL